MGASEQVKAAASLHGAAVLVCCETSAPPCHGQTPVTPVLLSQANQKDPDNVIN